MVAHDPNPNMSLERRQIVSILHSLGWRDHRARKGEWSFTRASTRGLDDVIRIQQSMLTFSWLKGHMLRNEDGAEFAKIVEDLWQTYLHTRFAKTFKEVKDV